MSIRRLVTGTVNGRSVILNDGGVPRHHHYDSIPGFSTALVWATPQGPIGGVSTKDPITADSSYVPGPGETRLIVATFPPDPIFLANDFDPSAAYAEQQRFLTGLVDAFDPERPGMHATHTIDYGVVLDGTITLELDDGVVEVLERNSIVVQQGNIHAWRNPSNEPATLLFVLVGVQVAE